LHAVDQGDINGTMEFPGSQDAAYMNLNFPKRKAKPLLVILLCSFLLASGCGVLLTSSDEPLPTPVEIVTKTELLEALDQAGVEVLETEMIPDPLYGVEGEIYQIGGALIMVFEGESPEGPEQIAGQLIARDYTGAEWFSLFPKPPHVWGAGNLILIYSGEEGGIILTLSALMGDPILGVESLADEPFPPAIVAAVIWLAQTLEVEPSEINVLEFEAVEWPNSCFGLPGMEEDCAQVIVPGWRIVVQYGQRTYAVRTDEVGSELRMELEGGSESKD
jgi:hypothetical protein